MSGGTDIWPNMFVECLCYFEISTVRTHSLQQVTVEDRTLTVESSSVQSILFGQIYGLLTKREVKMAGYWPSSLPSKLGQ